MGLGKRGNAPPLGVADQSLVNIWCVVHRPYWEKSRPISAPR
jgi:hypothetical protein